MLVTSRKDICFRAGNNDKKCLKRLNFFDLSDSTTSTEELLSVIRKAFTLPFALGRMSVACP